MRINVLIARSSGLSRRAADKAILAGRVTVNGIKAGVGQAVSDQDEIRLDNQQLNTKQTMTKTQLIMLNKPVGYVVSRNGQGSTTIYHLLPDKYQQLKPIGRLDKDSSGLLLLTNNGQLAQELTHPSKQKIKTYEVKLDKSLEAKDRSTIEQGVRLDDGISRLKLEPQHSKIQTPQTDWRVSMGEGRNRQIRRTFAALGYTIISLHRIQFGPYSLGSLSKGHHKLLSTT